MPVTVQVPRDQIVATAKKMLRRVLKRGVRTIYPHPVSNSCEVNRCAETHLLGSDGPGFFSPDQAIEGRRFEVYGLYSVHERKYVDLHAWFPGVFGDGADVSLTEEVLQ